MFLSVVLLVTLTNIAGIRRLGHYPQETHLGSSEHGNGGQPLVSILIPARNEERSIERCVRSLLAQRYENLEVIVLDDQSDDRTLPILQHLANNHLRLKLLQGTPPPAGWIGKPWACRQLASAAQGELLLFTDADTYHQPATLVSAVTAQAAEGIDLLSGLPEQETGTLGERLLLPMLSWVILALVPIPLARRLRLPFLSAAVGQFLLFRRQAYDQIGGHTALRSTSVEDLAFARRIKNHGLKWDFVHLDGLVSCRMYHSFWEAFRGISKNLMAVFAHHPLAFGFAWLWIVYAFSLPVVALGLSMAGISPPALDPLPAWLAVFLSLVLWTANNLYYRMPLVQIPFYPLTALLYGLMAARAGWYTLTGRSHTWKGRPLPSRFPEADR